MTYGKGCLYEFNPTEKRNVSLGIAGLGAGGGLAWIKENILSKCERKKALWVGNKEIHFDKELDMDPDKELGKEVDKDKEADREVDKGGLVRETFA